MYWITVHRRKEKGVGYVVQAPFISKGNDGVITRDYCESNIEGIHILADKDIQPTPGEA